MVKKYNHITVAHIKVECSATSVCVYAAVYMCICTGVLGPSATVVHVHVHVVHLNPQGTRGTHNKLKSMEEPPSDTNTITNSNSN
jgi:hypothetical protein